MTCAEKVHAEITAVIGSSRDPSITDRENMPYTNAVIHEIQRMANILPLNFFRMASKDTIVGNYTISKVNRAAKYQHQNIIIGGADKHFTSLLM